MKLKQKPLTMLGPTLIGLLGLYQAIWGPAHILGGIVFVASIVYWILVGFILNPKSNKHGALTLTLIVLLATMTLTACGPIAASPVPRAVNGVTIIDNPAAMNGDNLGILRYWFNYTHTPVNPIAATSTDNLLDLSTTAANASMPANVVMARQAWFDTGAQCIAGIAIGAGAFISTAANPPAGVGAVIVAWALNLGGDALQLSSCWDTFQWSVQQDAALRWLKSCNETYLTNNDWNILDPGWVPSNEIKWKQCLVFGWAAEWAGYLGNTVDANGIATLSNLICTDEIIPRCYYA